MESNECDINHLDGDERLPPRKRLLAGLKKQSSDGNSLTGSPSNSNSNGSEFDTRLKNLLRSHLSNPNISNDQIIELSKIEALEAVKVAQAARAAAEEKAAKAAKAIAAAKSALELVFSLEEAASGDSNSKQKKDKHVTVGALYKNRKGKGNRKTDEELAKKLHRAINSSPRALRSKTSAHDLKNYKHKRLKISSRCEKRRAVQNEGPQGESYQPSSSNLNGMESGGNSENALLKEDVARKDDLPRTENRDKSQLERTIRSGIAEAEMLKGKSPESPGDASLAIKRKGRIKQKKLPLSNCSFREQASHKRKPKSKQLNSNEENASRAAPLGNTLFPGGSSSDNVNPVDSTATWKCQTFKAPDCLKQNKVMQ